MKTPKDLKDVITELNTMIERRRDLLIVYGDLIEMVFINGHVHDCTMLPESNVYFRGKIPLDREGNVIPMRRFKL